MAGWCDMKLQPSRRKLCVHHTTMHHVTSCKATYFCLWRHQAVLQMFQDCTIQKFPHCQSTWKHLHWITARTAQLTIHHRDTLFFWCIRHRILLPCLYYKFGHTTKHSKVSRNKPAKACFDVSYLWFQVKVNMQIILSQINNTTCYGFKKNICNLQMACLSSTECFDVQLKHSGRVFQAWRKQHRRH